MIRVEIVASTSIGQMRPIGRHEIFGVDRPHGDDVVVGAGVAHHADALHRQQHGKDLGGLAVESGRLESRGPRWRRPRAACRDGVWRDVAQQAHRQSRAGERMPPDDLFGQAQLQAQPADFVFEQVAQRLDQLEAQILGQAADVVVQLDRGGRAIGRGAAFDHVGIERALGQEAGPGDFDRFVGESTRQTRGRCGGVFPADR